jgi:hypothetical protein
MSGYYRDDKVNPRWFGIFTEQVDDEEPEYILDQLAELACGIKKAGASDTVMSYARHIRVHIEAAYRVGLAVHEKRLKDALEQLKSIAIVSENKQTEGGGETSEKV